MIRSGRWSRRWRGRGRGIGRGMKFSLIYYPLEEGDSYY